MTHDTAQSSPRSPADLLEVRLAAPQRHGGLTVFPLLAEPSAPLPYVLLADALAAGSVTIGEVGSGTVPSLLAHNRGEADVLILDGEQLIGARQNRITNRTILLAAGGKTEIPVSCMEQGRWHFTTDVFATAPKARHAPAMVRRHARAAEAEVAAATGRVGRQAAAMAQGAVWSEIADYAAKLGGRSDTGAMDDVYRRRDADVEFWLRQFPLEPGQVGVLAFLEGTPLGLDAIGCPELFARLHARFLGGYVMDALAADGAGGDRTKGSRPGGEEAERFLAAMGAARRVPSDTVGKGQYRVLTGSAIGGELTDGVDDDRRLVHLSGFPPDRARTETRMAGPAVDVSPFAPPSRRRAGKPRVE